MTRPTVPICAKLSQAQIADLEVYLMRFYPGVNRSDYIRRLIGDDMAVHGFEWSEYEFIGNEKRKVQGMPWLLENKPEDQEPDP
jgi:hypothetical protein